MYFATVPSIRLHFEVNLCYECYAKGKGNVKGKG